MPESLVWWSHRKISKTSFTHYQLCFFPSIFSSPNTYPNTASDLVPNSINGHSFKYLHIDDNRCAYIHIHTHTHTFLSCLILCVREVVGGCPLLKGSLSLKVHFSIFRFYVSMRFWNLFFSIPMIIHCDSRTRSGNGQLTSNNDWSAGKRGRGTLWQSWHPLRCLFLLLLLPLLFSGPFLSFSFSFSSASASCSC